MFPVASEYFTPLIFTLSIIAIIYTSLVALMQEDMKKLIAYSSVAHMGFVTLGIFTFTKQGIEGSIFQMLSHGLISAALFLCVGVVYDRVHSRLISSYGGLVNILPKYSLVFAVFMLGAVGLPGTSGFVGEILVLLGAFQKNFLVAILASIGVILGAAYMLWLYKRVIFGKLEKKELSELKDLNFSESSILFLLAGLTLLLGFYPNLILDTIHVSVASEHFVPLVYTLSIIAIIYTSLVALMQEDMKKLIAYSSVAHMGFVTLGIFTFTKQGIEGSIFQMLSHGLISAALFLCVGVVYDRVHSRLISSYGGLVNILPKYSLVFAVFMLGAVGLPGTSGFVGEILVLLGAFQKNFLVAILASIGVILGAAYMLWLYKRVIFGKLEKKELSELKDLNFSESSILFLLAGLTLLLGFYPNLILDTIHVSVDKLINDYQMNLILSTVK